MHAGALHAPYASKYSEQQFVEVNVGGTANVLACGIPTVFTSTTSHTITNGQRMSCDHACAHTHVRCAVAHMLTKGALKQVAHAR